MTGDARFCPQCGTRRAGFFRFCPQCGFDYDELLPVEARRAADPKAPAPTQSTLAKPIPLPAAPARRAPAATAAPVPTAAPAATAAPVATAAPAVPAAPVAAPPKPAVWPPPGALPVEDVAYGSTTPDAVAARAALVGTSPATTRPVAPGTTAELAAPAAAAPAPSEVVRPSRGVRVLSRRPDLTLTRVAIVVLAALLGFSALSNMARSSSESSSTTSPQSSIGSPLTDASPSATDGAAPSSTVQPAFGPTGPTQVATVASITDGDTIRVVIDGQEFPVRYIGMDSPEPDATDAGVKQLAVAASAANASLVEGKEVRLEREVSDTDRFGRLLRDIWLVDVSGNYVLVNIELVRLGLAQIATFPPDVRYVREITAAQSAAQADGLGIWGLGQPVSPAAPGAEASPPEASPAAASTSPAAVEPTPQALVGGVPGSQCHPSYDPCLPVVDDLDCGEVRAIVTGPVTVRGSDDYHLDADGDGTACEVGY
jgi:micrococcal nuclease